MNIIISFDSRCVKNRTIFNSIVELICLGYTKSDAIEALCTVLMENNRLNFLEQYFNNLLVSLYSIENIDDSACLDKEIETECDIVLDTIEATYANIYTLLYPLYRRKEIPQRIKQIKSIALGADTIVIIDGL